MNVQVEEIESKTLNNHFGQEPVEPNNTNVVELPEINEEPELDLDLEQEVNDNEVYEEFPPKNECVEGKKKAPLFGEITPQNKPSTKIGSNILYGLMAAGVLIKAFAK